MNARPLSHLIAGMLVALSAPTLHAQALVITCPAASTVECSSPSTVTVSVSDTNAVDLTVVWSLNGASVQTNVVPSDVATNGTNVAYSAVLPLGTNLVGVSVTD